MAEVTYKQIIKAAEFQSVTDLLYGSMTIDYRIVLLDLFEHALADTADRAAPVIRQCFERCSGSDTAVGITFFRIIDISAGTALVFCGLIRFLFSGFFRGFRFSDEAFHQCRDL